MAFKKNNGFTLVEAIISLGLVAFISILSVKLLEPPPRQNSYGRKAGDFIEHLVSVHRQVELARGRAPLTPNLTGEFLDLDNSTTTTELGFPVSLIQNDTQANYCSSGNPECITAWTINNADYLDYPGGMRLYVRPEQFTWVNTLLGNAPFSVTNVDRTTVVPNPPSVVAGANRYKIQGFLLLDMDPISPPAGLNQDDLVLLYINNETGSISTVAQEVINALRATPPLPDGRTRFTCSFYDVHKRFNACTAIGGQAVLGA